MKLISTIMKLVQCAPNMGYCLLKSPMSLNKPYKVL